MGFVDVSRLVQWSLLLFHPGKPNKWLVQNMALRSLTLRSGWEPPDLFLRLGEPRILLPFATGQEVKRHWIPL